MSLIFCDVHPRASASFGDNICCSSQLGRTYEYDTGTLVLIDIIGKLF